MIKLLDEKTINRIAAGEVIENPSNVVKELIENSIDANAKNITINLKTDLSLIEVIDDGDGFYKDDIKNAFVMHATSKINDYNDIVDVASFGFRGEALTSIAAVSNVTLITRSRNEDSVGFIYNVDFGKAGELKEYNTNYGTDFKIENIFEKVPVRKKFLKDGRREMAEALSLIEKYAIIYTNISFVVYIDDKEKLNTLGNGNIQDVIYKIYGREISDNIIKLENITKGMYEGIDISGYIGAPSVIRSTRQDIIYFVNGRYIKSKIINDAIERGYSGYLMEHKFPMTFLMINIDGDKVDINVHPKKMEVRFSDEEKIYEAIRQEIEFCITNNLNQNNNILNDDIYNEDKDQAIDLNHIKDLFTDSSSSSDEFNKNNEVDNEINNQINDDVTLDKEDTINDYLKYKTRKEKAESFIEPKIERDFTYIGQLFKTYLLIEFNNEFYIIDQHAAHEKINYEKLMKEFYNNDIKKENLLTPIIIKLTSTEFISVLDNIERFDKMGFEIDELPDNTIKVSSIPSMFIENDKKDFLYELIKDFSDFKNDKNIKYDSIEERIATKACRKSIKANDYITEFEARALIKELFTLDNPYNCPHGRPTMIKYKINDIEKLFGRIV